MKTDNLNIFTASPENIWNYKQNHPELVIQDCKNYNFSNEQINIVRQSMLCRGINKWLKVRRDLIAYKKIIKHEVKKDHIQLINLKMQLKEKFVDAKDVEKGTKTIWDFIEYNQIVKSYLTTKELLKYKTKLRGDLKRLCMTDRWQLWKDKDLKEMNTINCSD